MRNFFIHVFQGTENRLERDLDRLQQGAHKLHSEAAGHLDFLHEAMTHLEGKMARVKAVQDAAGQLKEANAVEEG